MRGYGFPLMGAARGLFRFLLMIIGAVRTGIIYPSGGLQVDGPLTPTSGTAYAVYMGMVKCTNYIPASIYWATAGVAGVGNCTGETGLFSSPLPPNRAAQTLTKIVAGAFATNAFQATQTAYKNSSAFATAIPYGTYLWAVVRIVMATSQPNMKHVTGDATRGYAQTFAGASALTGITSLSGGAIPAAVAWSSGAAPAPFVTEF